MTHTDKEAVSPGRGRPYRGEDSASRISRRRAALIDSALELFGTHGFRSTSVKEVCAHAGLTERYFYESFANREALLGALYDHLVEQLDGCMREALQNSEDAPEARVRTVVRVFLNFMRNEQRARVMLVEISGISSDIDARYQGAIRNLARLLEHPDFGLFPPGSAIPKARKRMASIAMVGAITQVTTQWMLEEFHTGYNDVEASLLYVFQAVANRK